MNGLKFSRNKFGASIIGASIFIALLLFFIMSINNNAYANDCTSEDKDLCAINVESNTEMIDSDTYILDELYGFYDNEGVVPTKGDNVGFSFAYDSACGSTINLDNSDLNPSSWFSIDGHIWKGNFPRYIKLEYDNDYYTIKDPSSNSVIPSGTLIDCKRTIPVFGSVIFSDFISEINDDIYDTNITENYSKINFSVEDVCTNVILVNDNDSGDETLYVDGEELQYESIVRKYPVLKKSDSSYLFVDEFGYLNCFDVYEGDGNDSFKETWQSSDNKVVKQWKIYYVDNAYLENPGTVFLSPGDKFTPESRLYYITPVWGNPVISKINLNPGESVDNIGTSSLYIKECSGWFFNEECTQNAEIIDMPTKEGYTFDGYYYTNPENNEEEIKVINGANDSEPGKIIFGAYMFLEQGNINAKWIENIKPDPDPDPVPVPDPVNPGSGGQDVSNSNITQTGDMLTFILFLFLINVIVSSSVLVKLCNKNVKSRLR